jgi:transcription factor E2F3
MENNENITYQEPDERELIEKEMNELNMEENHLDEWITSIKNSFEKLTEDRSFKEYGYVTFDDIKALTVGEDINLIAIKAPAGTSLEIPDPDQIQNIYMQTLQVNIKTFFSLSKTWV